MGPTLTCWGTREQQVYGSQTLDDVRALCERAYAVNGSALEFRQINQEGELVDWLHEAGAYAHTSVALHDAIKGTASR